MNKIDGQRAFELLEVVTERMGADYVYKGEQRPGVVDCTYSEVDLGTGEVAPSCGVGHALVEAGVPVEWFNEAMVNQGGVSQLAPVLNRSGHAVLAHGAVRVFRKFQSHQDMGYSWGEALGAAREVMDSLGQ